MKNKIAVVVAYFGKFPNYFPLWIKSCGYNPTIDFIIFTDQELGLLPSNVKRIQMNLADMRSRASDVLGFEVALSRPYKCCDYKPIYGLIFKDYLSSYDYWGHCDVDLIFGDLQKFFDDYDLYKYDKFGMLGHLSLFKNTEKVNYAFMIPNDHMDYRDVYRNKRNLLFDELMGISTIMKENGFKVFTKRIFVDIATMYKRYRIGDAYPLDVRPVNYKKQTFYWENGKIYHVYLNAEKLCKEEYLYIHFQKRPNFEISSSVLNASDFFITNRGFIEGIPDNLSGKDLLRLNPYYGKFYEMIENKINGFYRRVKRFVIRKFSE